MRVGEEITGGPGREVTPIVVLSHGGWGETLNLPQAEAHAPTAETSRTA